MSGEATTLTLPIPGYVVLSGEAGGALQAVDPVEQWGDTPGAAPETVYLGAYLGSGKALLGGDGGSYVAEGTRVADSGLDGALGGPIGALAATQYGTGIEDVWLRAQGQLYLLSGGVSLKRYDLGSLPIQRGALVWGPWVETAAGDVIDGSALWVASGDDIYGLTVAEGGALSAWPRPLQGAASDIAAAGSQLYALGSDGILWVLEGADWRPIPIDRRFQDISGRYGAEGLWLLGEEGGLHRYHPEEGLYALDNALASPDAALVGVDPQGRGFVSAAGGVYRVSQGRPLYIHGLEPGESLDTLTTLTLLPTTSGESVALEVEVDGTLLSAGEGATLTVTLSPLNLEEGSHRLSAVARYADGHEVRREVDFLSVDVTPPTWGEDIEPIFRQSCAQCHGEGAFAHALYTPESWEEEIESILIQVEAGAMPLGLDPLTSSEIDRIRAWAETGFGR